MGVIKTEHLIENASRLGKIAMKRLEEMKERYEIIGDVRGSGLFIGVEIVKSKKTKERGEKESKMIMEDCFKNGLILISAGRNVLRVIPPLTTNEEELHEGLDILEDTISRANKSDS